MQPEYHRAGRALVAHRQRVTQVHEDRVGERGDGGPAQTEHDLVVIDAAGDPSRRRPDVPNTIGACLPGTLDNGCRVA